ncbi:hypothetical protein QBC32DRAFT_35693 [Pseudoneurospora amorphoporcata]|uniref:Uncharacterized protein n=1 Tax=Pseudoneurospora amorphoporcata TaxID=241081 RepID=A0AAN6SDT2_9PEZI|nr:hypothetical protein QBC32DRAFT_35693 [Pseudoneurospora amorphoporcata]
MRYASLVLISLLAVSHVCHGKPLPTPDDPPYPEGSPTEAESTSTTTSVETITAAEETTYPGLYPTATLDFPSKATETSTATTEEHSATEEEHPATPEEHKPIETSASSTSEEHEAPSDYEAPPNQDTSSHHAASSEHDAPSRDAASSDQNAPSDHDVPSDNDASSEHPASSDHAAFPDNEYWSQYEASPADSSPKPHDQDHPCGKLDPWTIHSLSRHCDDADTVCGWSFIIDTNCPSFAPTPCSFTIKSLGPGVPASRSPKHAKDEDELCGPYEVHSSWSGHFGPGQGFTTLSVIDGGNKLVAYPAYRDDLFGKDKATVPDVEVAVYALG